MALCRLAFGPGSAFADYRREVICKPGVAFARSLLEPLAIDDRHDAAAGRDQPLVEERPDNRIDRRALDSKQVGEGFLSELDPVAGTVLRVEEPACCALGN